MKLRLSSDCSCWNEIMQIAENRTCSSANRRHENQNIVVMEVLGLSLFPFRKINGNSRYVELIRLHISRGIAPFVGQPAMHTRLPPCLKFDMCLIDKTDMIKSYPVILSRSFSSIQTFHTHRRAPNFNIFNSMLGTPRGEQAGNVPGWKKYHGESLSFGTSFSFF